LLPILRLAGIAPTATPNLMRRPGLTRCRAKKPVRSLRELAFTALDRNRRRDAIPDKHINDLKYSAKLPKEETESLGARIGVQYYAGTACAIPQTG
jgi:hypothetical protein